MKSKRNMKIVRGILLIVIIACLAPLGRACYFTFRHRQQEKSLKELREMIEPEPLDIAAGGSMPEDETKPNELYPCGGQGQSGEGVQETGTAGTGQTIEPEGVGEEAPQRSILEKYRSLYEENPDLAGWLSIEGMVIDYPVMQCGDDEYYLHHDFYGSESKYGCLYVRSVADVNTPGTNFIIYGHNMKDGSMFGDLDLYRRESFFQEHPTISFDTLYEERVYDVIAVFRSRVYHSDENAFKYYQFYQARSREEFDYFYENIKELSLYDTGVTAEFGDSFVTLSTCAYHEEDGRFVVVAKARQE